MTEPTDALLPCPFCGEAAKHSFNSLYGDMSMASCKSCGATAYAPKWNRRAILAKWGSPVVATKVSIPTSTMEQEFQNHYRRGFEAGKKAGSPVVAGEPIGYLYCGGSYGDELADWEIVADQHQCDKLNEHYGALGEESKHFLYTTPQPTQAQAGAVPLTVSQIRDWWASENGLEDCEMCKITDFLRVVRAVEEKHGIKEGGQHADQ